MSSNKSRVRGAAGPAVPIPEAVASFGALSFLAAHCPVHQRHTSSQLRQLFQPAVEHSCVRFFQNSDGLPCAALIWARLSDEVSERMIFDSVPPSHEEWNSGVNLWFLDLIAPFGHGREIARYIARNPPDGPFFFARISPDGRVRRVVEGDRSKGQRGLVRSFLIDQPETRVA